MLFSEQAIQKVVNSFDIRPGMILGVGTGRTVEAWLMACFQKGLLKLPESIIVSSLRSQSFLENLGISSDLMQHASHIDVYVDGVDAINPQWECLKGMGGAMTGEKLCLHMAKTFIVIYDSQKEVPRLTEDMPLPVELVSWARSIFGRMVVGLGGRPILREKKSELGNDIIDCYGLSYAACYELDKKIAYMPGVISHGLFVRRKPDIAIKITGDVVEKKERTS